jgi:hypothetical protein
MLGRARTLSGDLGGQEDGEDDARRMGASWASGFSHIFVAFSLWSRLSCRIEVDRR